MGEDNEIKYDPDMIVQNAQNDCTKIIEYAQDHIDRLNVMCDDAETRFNQHIEAAKQWARTADDLRGVLGKSIPERSFTI